VAADGDIDTVVDRYLSAGYQQTTDGKIPADAPRTGTGTARFRTIAVVDAADRPISQLYLGQPFRIVAGLEVEQPIADAIIEVGISALDGTRVLSAFSVDGGVAPAPLQPGRHSIRLDVRTVLLPRAYVVDLALHHSGQGTTIDLVERALDFLVLNAAERGGDRYVPGTVRGFVRPEAQWRVEPVTAPIREVS
jgi:hypothetical protein